MKPLLDDKEYIFNLDIHGKQYNIDVKWLLHLENAITSDLSSIELQESLEKVGGYLHTFLAAFEEITRRKIEEELDYEIWYKETYAKAEMSLLSVFSEEVKSGIRSKTNGTPNRTQIEARIIVDYKDEYRKRTETLNKIKTYWDFLSREMKIIEIRATNLQSILNFRRKVMEKEY
uniref:Uncharacterized protein n=1 Tax=viral metagenome TaxID=1070528 RepID=A0A6H1ZCH3_9ZZZZ